MESSEPQREVDRIATEQTVNAVFEILADGGATTYIADGCAHSRAGGTRCLRLRIGAEYLRRMGFSEQLVEARVDVKRYLTGKDKAYYETLSTTSKLSLREQGGSFTPEQCIAFELDPLSSMFQVRRWDDGAKVVGWHAPD
ncbi:hypothetical protein BC937DRAFT_93006 [Endogone sp. FLAS-F59071]|nr:hypothetical protein BC937DRAFT_93006 [Endogone sp. FLAS-F59071]|eukprot:RUS23051.1 hypothetical protein BC937DRAFT_93006 [Endogone sp. FLAS-F59071]